MMHFANHYRRLNEPVAPDSALTAETLSRMKQAGKAPHRGRALRRVLVAAAVGALAVGCGAPALAAGVPSVYEMMYAVSPATAQFFMPVNRVCEDQGVRMEVISAAVHGDTAEVYLTMRDVDGSRFDGSLDLFDSYSLNNPTRSNQSCGCTLTEYNDETRTATFLIEITNMDGAPFRGGKYTFSVRSLLTGQQTQQDVPVLSSLAGVPQAPATERLDVHGASFDPDTIQPDIESGYDFLRPQGTLWQSEDGVFTLSATGYRDNRLHLLFHTAGVLDYDNHAWFHLRRADGTMSEPEYTMSHREPDGEPGLRYTEFVFDVPYEELPDCGVSGELHTSDTLIEGNWRVTFEVE